MNNKKKHDAQMAAANDKDGRKAAAAEKLFNPAIPEKVGSTVGKVMDGIKKKAEKAKKLPAVVETSERRIVNAKYAFSKEELNDVAKRLTDRLCDLSQVEDEKKSVMANYTDKIKAAKLEIGKLSRNHRDGYELREHECFIVYDYKKREKRFKSISTKAIIEVQPFGPGDDQRRMPI